MCLVSHTHTHHCLPLPALRIMASLSPFEPGEIKAHLHHGLGLTAIAGRAAKSGGTHVSTQGVCDAKRKLDEGPAWCGERTAGSGRPRKTGASTDWNIARDVIRRRGRSSGVHPPQLSTSRLRALGPMLLQRLNTPMPMHRESRTGFITRFRAAVDWLNAHRSELLMKGCTHQTVRSGTVMLRETARTRD